MARVLVIEDDQNIREVLAEILDLAGHDVSTAPNGKTGYNLILESKPDIVLCDVNMPDLNGFDLLTALNQKLENKVVPPFLFLTAMAEPADIRTGLNLGADDYITKPFDHKEILDIVKLRLNKRKKLLDQPSSISVNSKPHFSKLSLPSEDGLTIIPFDDIICCEADRANCDFILKDGRKLRVSRLMKEFEDKLLAKDFIKIHKSTIVNFDHIEKYLSGNGGQLQMSDGTLLNVSSRKKKELLDLLKSIETSA